MKKDFLRRFGVFAAGLSVAVAASAADPVKIGVAVPLTGAAASYGTDTRLGAEAAADRINAAGGILGGRKIELVFEDDKGTPQGGVAAVQKLISVNRCARRDESALLLPV